MGSDELIAFIINSRQKGRANDQIIRALLSVGWRKDQVEWAFKRITEMEADKGKDAYYEVVESHLTSPQQAPSQQTTAQPAQQPVEQKKKSFFTLPSFGKKKDGRCFFARID